MAVHRGRRGRRLVVRVVYWQRQAAISGIAICNSACENHHKHDIATELYVANIVAIASYPLSYP